MTTPSKGGMPPRRSEHRWSGPAGPLAYDRWGTGGRPVLFVHGPMFDRTMWWPAAADLAAEYTVLAVDLPGHGATPPRPSYRPAALVEELALLVDELGGRRAPIVVGHSTSALLASMFGARFAVHAIVNVGQSLDVRPFITGLIRPDGANIGRFLAELGLESVPSMYRSLVVPHTDGQLLADHLDWMAGRTPHHVQQELDAVLRKIRAHHLNIFGNRPWDGYAEWLRERIPTSRCLTYERGGQFPHLDQVSRFAADLRALL